MIVVFLLIPAGWLLVRLFSRPSDVGSSQQGTQVEVRAAQSGYPSDAALRQQLRAELGSDSDFQASCLDYFRSEYERMSSGMNRLERENTLIELASAEEIRAALEHHAKTRPTACTPLYQSAIDPATSKCELFD